MLLLSVSYPVPVLCDILAFPCGTPVCLCLLLYIVYVSLLLFMLYNIPYTHGVINSFNMFCVKKIAFALFLCYNEHIQTKGVISMITYRKLFHLLLDRNIKKKDLQEQAGITASIMARLAKDENVQVDTISKICDALNCQPGDIMENVPKLQDFRREV